MDNLTQLFIRACKENDSFLRVQSVYRRFYIKEDDWEYNVIGILSNIVDTYLTISTLTLIDALGPGNKLQYGISIDDEYYKKCVLILISLIKLKPISVYPGLTMPLKIKNIIKELNE